MPTEGASYISQLDATNPTGAAPKSEGDDQLRQLKAVLKTQFPNFGAAALNATTAQLDKLVTTFNISSALAGAVTVDSSGILGIGTAPSAWVGARAIDFTQSGGLAVFPFNAVVASNAFYDGSNWRYKASAFATRYETNVGNTGMHAWYAAASGVAGGVVSFAQAMLLDVNGNLVRTLNTAAPALTADKSMVVSLPSDTQLRISVRGSDGVTRTANITLS